MCIRDRDRIAAELKKCADTICQVDNQMQGIRRMIERRKWESEEERGKVLEHRIEERGNLMEDD